MNFQQRIAVYCKEQLEPGSRLLLSFLVTLMIALLVGLDFRKKIIELSFLIPCLSSFILLIYYRVSDEFKDYKTDLKFFPDRPIPSGRLFLTDLQIALIVVSVIGAGLNLLYPYALIEYAAAFVFTFAMGKWFFMEKWISSNRLLAFFTHAPVGLFLYWYVEAFILNFHQVDWSLPEKLVVIGFIVLPGLSWEILRKTYLPEDEMPGYQIYSTMLGFKGSLLFASIWIVLTLLNDIFISRMFQSLEGMEWFLVLLNLILLAIVFFHGRRPKLKNLKPIAELYMALHMIIPLILLIIRSYQNE